MSLSSVFISLGNAVGAAFGGLVLALSGSYYILALSFMVMNFIAVAIYYGLTTDPFTKQNMPAQAKQELTLNS